MQLLSTDLDMLSGYLIKQSEWIDKLHCLRIKKD